MDVHKILVADDSVTIQRVFERTLPSEEFRLFFATDGQEALDKAAEILPHLIIADLNMPVKGGLELCQELKKDPKLGQIPVLLLVGVLDEFDEDEVERVGATGYIVKPFETEVALAKIREVLVHAPAWEEEVIELTEVVEEPEEGEKALELEVPLERPEDLEEPVQREEGAQEEIKLDISLDEISLAEEAKPSEVERIEQVLEESVAELEKMEEARREPVMKDEFVKAFQEEFVKEFVPPPSAPELEKPAEEAPAARAGQLEEALRTFVRAMAQEMAQALSEEIKRAVKEALKEVEK